MFPFFHMSRQRHTAGPAVGGCQLVEGFVSCRNIAIALKTPVPGIDERYRLTAIIARLGSETFLSVLASIQSW